MIKHFKVAVNTPFNGSILTYAAEDINYQPGTLVKVPLGKNRIVDGCILGIDPGPINTKFEIKKILNEVETTLRIPSETLSFYQWACAYYKYPLGQHIFDCLPKILKRPRELIPIWGKGEDFSYPLTEEQNIALNAIESSSRSLIHGVTGSGKSVLYLKRINEILKTGKSCLFILPEINLTPQFLEFFSKHTSAPIYSYHSSISNSEKYGLWNILLNDKGPKIIIGVRSSIFLPLEELGLIIVDEEHDQSFKQDDRCPYNARDLSVKLASNLKIPILIGSATPSVETYYSYKIKERGVYTTLKKRALTSKLPKIELIDMRQEKQESEDLWPFSNEALIEIKEAIERKEQVLVFVNRLGFSSFVQCKACGHQFYCPNCSIPLKFFRKKNSLSCQTCEYKEPFKEYCPECGNMNLTHQGFGTEKLANVLEEKFPSFKVGRFDRDELKTQNQVEDRLKEFHSGQIDILVGTQMLAKGHNFKKVNTVLILGIDSQLNFPDFRSNERVYQLLTQVSGRSGRFGSDSRVLIQTFNPESKVFELVKAHSFDEFYEDELEIRKLCQTPPFSKLAVLTVSSRFQDRCIDTVNTIAANFNEKLSQHFDKVELLGPKPAFVERRKNQYTWVILFKAVDFNQLSNLLKTIEDALNLPSGVSLKVDIDPYMIP